MEDLIVVFDFDKTIIDCDSDNWVIDNLGATARFEEVLQTSPWNSVMNSMMEEFHAAGIAIDEIASSLKRAPLHPSTIAAIQSAHALGCELRIVSDANRFFIETILEHHGLLDYFKEITTNPGFVDEAGRLHIGPFHGTPHGCGSDLCPPNMCKGRVLQRIKEEEGDGKRRKIIYLGDGKGDFCPALKLGREDHVMPRIRYPLSDLILTNPALVAASVHEWCDADEQREILLRLIYHHRQQRLGSQFLETAFPHEPLIRGKAVPVHLL